MLLELDIDDQGDHAKFMQNHLHLNMSKSSWKSYAGQTQMEMYGVQLSWHLDS